jgi:hypothetical protein
MNLHKRLEKLEAAQRQKSLSLSLTVRVPPSRELEDYVAALEGREVPYREDPALDAYFAELEEYRAREIERSKP